MSLYHLDNARNPSQLAAMVRLEEDRVCVFCPQHLAGNSAIQYAADGWTILPNLYPYESASRHMLLIPDRHITNLGAVPAADEPGFFSAVRYAEDALGVVDYAFAVRCGKCSVTGGTVEHLHAHLIVPVPGDPVRFRIGC